MTGYVRKDTTNNIADGNVINAADLDSEFDGLQDAFNASTGHKHDGTASEGATINALGPTQDVTVSSTLLAPKTTNTVDIGSSALKFKDLFLAGNSSVGGTLAVTGVATFTAQPILSSLTASRAVFSDGSKGLVSNAITGTGNVVMSTSPTLVTPTLGVATATSLQGIIGNVTPAAGTFTQLDITAQGPLRLQDTTGGEYVGLRSPSALGASYTLTFPADDGTSGQALITDGSGVLSWSTAASGDVYGPGSSTDNAVARFDSTTGKIIQNSVVIIDDTGNVSGVGTLAASGLVSANANLKVVNGANDFGTIQLGTSASYVFTGGATYSGYRFEAPLGQQYDFQTGGTTRVLINGTGLAVTGTLSASGLITATAGVVVGTGAGTYTAGSLGFSNSNEGFLYRPPVAGLNTAHNFQTFGGTKILGITEAGVVEVTGALTVTGTGSTGGFTSTASGTAASPSIQVYGGGEMGFFRVAANQLGVAAGGVLAATVSSTGLAVTGTLSSTLDATIYGVTVGRGAGAVATNTAVGVSALAANTTGATSVAIGNLAAQTNSTGSNVTAIGYKALNLSTTDNNTAVGMQAGRDTSSGTNNVFMGKNSAVLNSTGGSLVAIGVDALFNNTTASNNTAVGYQAGYANTTGAQSTYIGVYAGNSVTTGTYNSFLGYGSGVNVTTGSKNTIIGSYNGNQDSLDIRTADNYIVLSDGDGNPRGIFDGSGNFLVGATTSAATNNTDGFRVIAGGIPTVQRGAAGSFAIFYNYSDSATIGTITNSGGVATLYNTTSDQRLKENIQDSDSASNLIDSLQVRQFDWKSDDSHQRYGFVAQELVNVAPEAVYQPKDPEEMMAVDYSKLVPMLVKEVQSLRKRLADAGL